MGWNCWARQVFSALWCVLCVVSSAQSFGRFGYNVVPEPPGFDLTLEGFRVKHPLADKLSFRAPMKVLKPVSISDVQATYTVSGDALAPDKLRVNIFVPGFDLYSEGGLDLLCTSTGAPWLTWNEATVEPNVPTAPTKWVAMTFRDKQPPILFGFLGEEKPELIVRGRPGNWNIRTTSAYKGWVRIALPNGQKELPSNTVSVLGQLAHKISQHEAFWLQEPAKVIQRTVEVRDGELVLDWKLSATHTSIPPPFFMSDVGGYKVKVSTGVVNAEADFEDGPTYYNKTDQLRVTFPFRSVKPGRALVRSPLPWVRYRNTVDRILLQLLSCRPLAHELDIESDLDSFLNSVALVEEPVTQQVMPYDAAGKGIPETAEAALLQQALWTSTNNNALANAWSQSLIYRKDSRSQTIWCVDPTARLNATALLAVSEALSQDPERWANACLLQAGLASERAWPIFARKRGIASRPTVQLNPAFTERAFFFRFPDVTMPLWSVENALDSSIRVLSEQEVKFEFVGEKPVLTWMQETTGPQTLVLLSNEVLEFSKAEGVEWTWQGFEEGVVTVGFNCKSAGMCRLVLSAMPEGYDIPVWKQAN